MKQMQHGRWQLLEKNVSKGSFRIEDRLLSRVEEFLVEDLHHVIVADAEAYIFMNASDPIRLDLRSGAFYLMRESCINT